MQRLYSLRHEVMWQDQRFAALAMRILTIGRGGWKWGRRLRHQNKQRPRASTCDVGNGKDLQEDLLKAMS